MPFQLQRLAFGVVGFLVASSCCWLTGNEFVCMDTWMGLPFAFRPRLQHRLLTLYGRGGGPAMTVVAGVVAVTVVAVTGVARGASCRG